jgi:hypothetical protein
MKKASPRAKKILWIVVIIGLVVHIAAAGLFFYNTRDRHPDYVLDLNFSSPSGPLAVGFSAVPITPDIPEPWTDKNDNGKFEKDIDTWDDRDGDGEFDGVWIAGFSAGRAASGIHDDLWARTMVIDNGSHRVSITMLDAIGLFHDDVLDIRELATGSADINYSVIASTHVHEAPDLMGLWGKSHLSGGVNQEYLDYVKKQAAVSIIKASENLEPAILKYYETNEGTEALVRDNRLPIVKDTVLRILQAFDPENDKTLGTLVLWADHPETLWSENLEITSDFPHFFRQGLEEGIRLNGKMLKQGTGGTAVYANGCIGGLLTTDRSIAVTHPFSGDTYSEPSFEKAEAQGTQLAFAAIDAMEGEPLSAASRAAISLQASTLEVPLDNLLFILGSGLGILDRGHSSWLKLRTEISVLSIGPFTFLCLPGEVYPELVYGGITTPEGRDYPSARVENPPLIKVLPGRHKLIIGLANDEIGYIIPKSEWDKDPPYLYGKKYSPYGEMNSPGPDAGAIIRTKAIELISRLKNTAGDWRNAE